MSSPVFILGYPRSGTSILYRTLLKHPSFSPTHLCLEETRIFLKPLLGVALDHGDDNLEKSLQNYMLNNQQLYNAFYKKAVKIGRFQSGLLKFQNSSLFKHSALFWILARNAVLIRYYFELAQKARNCQRIVEKTPWHIFYIKRILFTYPFAKLIYIVRHPIQVYASHMRRLKLKPNETYWDVDPDKFIYRYKKSMLSMVKITKLFKRNSMILRYEDFVHNPEKWYQDICYFLKEPFEPNALSLLDSEIRFASNKQDPLLAKKIEKNDKDWQGFINQDTANYIERGLSDVMNLIGYSFFTNES